MFRTFKTIRKVFIYGSGATGKKVIKMLNTNVEVMGFIDSFADSKNESVMGIKVFPPNRLKENDFEFVIIASMFQREILEEIDKQKVNLEKVVIFPLI
jgi:FlaA1/EpsC-like NDP-sugar epimerase